MDRVFSSFFLNRLDPKVSRAFDDEHFAFVGTEDGFDINNCFALYEDHDGDLWFGGRNGLFRYDGQKLQKMQTTAGLGERSVSAIAQDSQGQFLLGHWENEKKEIRDFFVSPLRLIYQRGEQFQTIFFENEKKDPYSRIGTVIDRAQRRILFSSISPKFLRQR